MILFREHGGLIFQGTDGLPFTNHIRSLKKVPPLQTAIANYSNVSTLQYSGIFSDHGNKFLHHELDRGCDAAVVKRIRIHDLRHSHVSMLIDMGCTPVDVSNSVGHENIDITMHYAHMFPKKQLEIANRLGSVNDWQEVI